jgi:hypothetical protein
MKKSDLKNIPEYFVNRIKMIKEEDLIKAFENSFQNVRQILLKFPEEKIEYRYDQGKWTIKELLGHLIDLERIMSFWALMISRRDDFEFSRVDQEGLAKNSNANSRTLQDLLDEYSIVRESTIALFKSFDDNILLREGKSAGAGVSLFLLGFIMIIHEMNHLNTIKEKYL